MPRLRSLALTFAIVLAACGDGSGPGGGGGSGATGGSDPGGAGGAGGSGGEVLPPAPDPVGWTTTADNLAVGRRLHTATLLLDGRVLVVGGENVTTLAMLDAVELFDPLSETFELLAPLPEPRSNHTATLLPDGRVLIAGGGQSSAIGVPSGDGVLDSALLFDPATKTFAATGSLGAPRAGHQAVLLPGGKVLVAGGGSDVQGQPCTVIPNCTVAVALASAEIYDAQTGMWSTTQPMAEARLAFTLTSLLDGGALAVAGAADVGSLKTAERFDAAMLSWTTVGSLAGQDRLYHSAALLGSGNVVLAGGKKADVSPLQTSELFDVATNAWTKVSNLHGVRTGAAMVSLSSGHALMTGGYDQLMQTDLAVTEIFDEATGDWTEIAPLEKSRALHTATLLLDGRVLVCGGAGTGKSCELSL